MKIKFILLSVSFASFVQQAISQNVGINSTAANPDNSAMLDIVASDKGLLIPRVALTAANAAGPITSPATSLLIYNTATAGTTPNNVTPGYYYNSGTTGAPSWVKFYATNSKAWETAGNAGTTAGTDFLGTTDAIDFVTKTNNLERMRILSSGKVGINTSAPLMRLDVTDASTTADDATIRGAATGAARTYGVYGISSSTITNASGLKGEANGAGAVNGVWGASSAAAGTGLYGLASSSTGDGVFGYNSAVAGAGTGCGVIGISAQSGGVFLASGIYGFNSNSAGTAVIGLGANVTAGQTNASGGGGAFTTAAGYGVMGTHYNGINGNRWGTLGGSTFGAYGQFDATHYGFIGTANNGAEFSNTAATAGTGYFGPRAGVSGYTSGAAGYNFGLGGYNGGNAVRSGGVHGAYSPTIWGAFGYRSSAPANYGMYATSSFTAGAGFLDNSNKTGIAIGSYGDLMGGWSRGEVMGHLSSGELFASYNLGDEYTSGHQIELIESGNVKVAAYSITSTSIKIYADGNAELKNGFAFVKFSEDFIKLLGDNPNVTVSAIGESEGLHIKEITKTGFAVKENKNGTSSIQFTWIAVGNRVDDKNKAEIPRDLTDVNFDENMKGVMFNESDTKHSGKPIWWDGTKLRFDAAPVTEKESVKDFKLSSENKNVIMLKAKELKKDN